MASESQRCLSACGTEIILWYHLHLLRPVGGYCWGGKAVHKPLLCCKGPVVQLPILALVQVLVSCVGVKNVRISLLKTLLRCINNMYFCSIEQSRGQII